MPNILFSSSSHVWSATPFTCTWRCVFDGAVYHVTHIMIFPEGAIQLKMTDDTAIQLYLSVQWIQSVLLLDTFNPIPVPNRRNKIRFLEVRCRLIDLYRAPATF